MTTISTNGNDVLRNKPESERIAADVARYLESGGTVQVLDIGHQRTHDKPAATWDRTMMKNKGVKK